MGFDTPTTDTTIPNVPDWSEDENSPLDTTVLAGADEVFTFGDIHDLWLVMLEIDAGAGSSNGFTQLQINQDTGSNYEEVFEDASTATSSDTYTIAEFGEGDTGHVVLLIDGRFNGACQVKHVKPYSPRNLNSRTAGYNSAVSSPLDSITYIAGNNDHDIVLEAYGRDQP